ncbi:MAG: carboxypeptidase regulatory-like domain-containing protein [bacterium]
MSRAPNAGAHKTLVTQRIFRMRFPARHTCAAFIVNLLAAWSLAAGQSRTVSGVILDSITRRPLNGTVVELRNGSAQRIARTDEAGVFRINAVPVGTYRFVTRRIGYGEFARDLDVTNDTSITIAIWGRAQQLDTLRTRSAVTAVYGTVGTFPGMLPIARARVQVMGLNQATTTDSTGAFFIPLKKAGQYLVRVSHEGYADQLLSFDLPAERATEVTALLETSDVMRQNDAEGLWADFDRRAAWLGQKGTVVSGLELTQSGGTTLTDAIRGSPSYVRKGLRVGPTICVFVNGKSRPGLPLDATPIENVLVVELYASGGDPTHTLARGWPRGSPCGESINIGMGPERMGNTAGLAKWAVIWTNQ